MVQATQTLTSGRARSSLDKRHRLDTLLQQLRNERASFESHWRELTDFILPRRGRFFTQDSNRGERRTRRIIDSTATLAQRTLMAGMMAGVTSPARPWFRLTTPDPALAELSSVKQWLSVVTQRMISVLLQSNLYQILPRLYKDLGTFATGAILLQEDFDKTFRAFDFPIGSFYIAQDENGRVNTFAREFRMTVRQIVEMFTTRDTDNNIDFSNVSTTVQDQWNLGSFETWIEVCHVIAPNPEFDPERTESKFKKWMSVYFEIGSRQTGATSRGIDPEKFLRESGFDIFPVLAPRWDTSGEDIYGTDCPGMTALGDVRQLQLGERRGMQAIEKMVYPSLKGPSSLRSRKVSLLPGDLTLVDEREGQRGLTPIHEVNPLIRELEGKQEQVRARIRRAYFEDLFLMLAQTTRREITATEIEERIEEKLLALGSVLEQLNNDLLDPLIDMVFAFMFRQGQIPEPPEELQGVDLKVEYISIMAQAQKLTGLVGIERLVGFVGQVAQTKPEVLDKLDTDQLVDVYADTVGVPPSIIVSDDVVAEIREQRAEQQRQAAQLQAAQEAAAAAKDLSKADLEKDSVLSRIAEAGEAGAVAPAA